MGLEEMQDKSGVVPVLYGFHTALQIGSANLYGYVGFR